MRIQNKSSRAAMLACAILLVVAPIAARVSAQATLTLSFSPSTTVPAPDGQDFVNGFSDLVTVTAAVTGCGRPPCSVILRTTQANVTKAPSSPAATTALDYSLNGTTFQAVPVATGNNLGTTIGSTTSSGAGSTAVTVTFYVRYRLGWSSASASNTPPATYTLPIDVSVLTAP